MRIYTMSIHSIYLVSHLEVSDNGDPLWDYLLPLAVIHRSNIDMYNNDVARDL